MAILCADKAVIRINGMEIKEMSIPKITIQILAIDPGPTQSAWVLLDEDGGLTGFGKNPNQEVLLLISENRSRLLAVERIASYGMRVGLEVFDTAFWSGRFIQHHGGNHRLVFRRDVKLHHTGRSTTNDADVRQVLIDRFGPGKDKAIGKKKSPGPLYGVKADVWQALALALYVRDRLPL